MSKKININDINCPVPISAQDTIQLSHGSGGMMSQELITNLFVKIFDNKELQKQDDNAILNINGMRLSFSTDSYVVDPIFFPGGNIGSLAVHGTINDVAMSGARPLYLSCGCIIEEGFPISDLKIIVNSMKEAADTAGVKIVTGDTKVVNKGKGDKIFINTSGIGIIEHEYIIGADNLQVNDAVILSGTIADHGICILSQREGLSFSTDVESDTASLHNLVQTVLQAGGSAVHAFRDPTRGGVAASLNEFASSSSVGIRIKENLLPFKNAVKGAAEMLGLDPLYIANEGKLLTIVAREKADDVLTAMRNTQPGKDAVIIGEVVRENPGTVQIQTILGTWRIVDMPVGEQLPRIC